MTAARKPVAGSETTSTQAVADALDANLMRPALDLQHPASPPRWLHLGFPQLALDLIERAEPPSSTPMAIVDGPAQRAVIYLANRAALTAGVQPGMRLPAAQALAPLIARPRDALAETKALELLAAFAYGYTSRIAVDHGLTLEIGASLALFGGIDALHQTLADGIDRLGFKPAFGYGHSPCAARLRALFPSADRDAPLSQIPLGVSSLDTKTIASLAATGIHTHGELMRLPRNGVARRYGQRVVDYLLRLQGELPEALTLYRPPDRYHAWLELPSPCAGSDALAYPLRRLLTDLAAQLAARDGGVERFTLRFALERAYAGTAERRGSADGDVVRLDVGLLESSRDPERLFALAMARLDHFVLPRPVLGIHLEVSRLPTFIPTSDDLFDDPSIDPQALTPLLERLRARLGEQRLRYPLLCADHRIEYAQRWCPAPANGNAPVARGPRPAWLLPQPIAIRIDDFRLLSSAERIEGGWWDDNDQRRDYYRAEVIRARQGQALGARAFVFRDLREPGRWFLHGWM